MKSTDFEELVNIYRTNELELENLKKLLAAAQIKNDAFKFVRDSYDNLHYSNESRCFPIEICLNKERTRLIKRVTSCRNNVTALRNRSNSLLAQINCVE